MDLFNAATMGVDPKTGTYLSKEQRVAMFRASRGQGGGNGGGKTPKGGNSNVKPQSALVVAEKMNGIVKSLSQNFKASTEGVKEQVNKNTQNIEDLYNFYEKDKAQEVKVEKKETRDQKLLAGKQLRKKRESLIEGTAKAAAAAARLGAKALDKMKKPVMGFLQKLGKALMFLGGAWLMKNLPAVLETFDKFKENVLDFKEKYFDSITDIRGVFSILDNILKGVKKTLGNIAKKALDLGGKLFRKAGDFAGKVTKAIGNFAKNVAQKIADALLNIWKKALNLIPKKPPVAPKPALPAAGQTGGGRTGAALAKTSQRGGQLATGAAKGGNIFSGMGNWFKGVMGGGTTNGAPTATGDLGDAAKGATEAKQVSWLKKAMKPIADKFPGAMKLFGKFAKGALRTIPVLGFLIDLALNKGVDGEPWIQAILSSLASSTAGAVGAAAGAKAGFALGGAIGLPFGGVGAFVGAPVGAAIGGIVGGMLAGMTADNLVDGMFEGNVPAPVGSLGDALGSPTSSMDAALTPSKGEGDHSPLVNIPKIEGFSKGSTPSGMQEKVDTGAAFSGAQIIEMPPIMTDMRTAPNVDDKINTEVQQPPRISSSDPDMDAYRVNSAKEYQMVVN